MFTRREVIAGSAGLAAAGSVSPAALAVDPDPVVILWHKLEAARKVASEKSARAEALHDAIPAPYKGSPDNFRVPVEHITRRDGGGTERTIYMLSRAEIEAYFEGERVGGWPPAESYKARLRKGLEELDRMEAEWHVARAPWESAETETLEALAECDHIEDEIAATPATTREGIACKIEVAVRSVELYTPDGQPTIALLNSIGNDIPAIP